MSRESREARRRLETGVERSLQFVRAGHEAGQYSAENMRDFERHTRKTLRENMSMDEYVEGRKNGKLDILLEDIAHYDKGDDPYVADARAETFAKKALADAASAMWERELLGDAEYVEQMHNAGAVPPDVEKLARDGEVDTAAVEQFFAHRDPRTLPGPKPDLERPTDTEVKEFKTRQDAWKVERDERWKEASKPPKPSEEKPRTLENPWETPADKPVGTDRGDGMTVIGKVQSQGESAQAQAAGDGLAGAGA